MLVLVLVAAGCGRIDFDRTFAPGGDDGGSDRDSDGAAPHRWALVQAVGSTTSPVTIAPSTSGTLIVVAVHATSPATVTAIADDAGNSYAAIPAAHATNSSPPDDLELWYASDARPGATAITVTANSLISAVIWEVAGIQAASPLDTATVLDSQAATTTPIGPSITTAGAGELVISVAIVANGISGTHAGNEFTNDLRTRGDGWAHLTDPAAPAGTHQAEWDQGTSGRYCATAAAFLPAP